MVKQLSEIQHKLLIVSHSKKGKPQFQHLPKWFKKLLQFGKSLEVLSRNSSNKLFGCLILPESTYSSLAIAMGSCVSFRLSQLKQLDGKPDISDCVIVDGKNAICTGTTVVTDQTFYRFQFRKEQACRTHSEPTVLIPETSLKDRVTKIASGSQEEWIGLRSKTSSLNTSPLEEYLFGHDCRSGLYSNSASPFLRLSGVISHFDEADAKMSFTIDKKMMTSSLATGAILGQPPRAGGQWLAFQIGFLLMSIASCVNREDPFREDVDLIWFPTGGGKTEAYLALTAFTLFYDRLAKGEDCFGVQVLMRYTLRLLTTQQFTRAATLICAMKNLRQQRGDLGDQPYSIGLWVGGANTPNTHLGAQDDLKRLQSGKGENRFLLNKCPWCAAAMGPSQKKGKARKQLTPGYKKSGDGISLHCPDSKCDFSHQLPVLIVDEDIYQQRPSLLIGTVDKFAQLSWRSDVRRLFGIDEHGKRQLATPTLINQINSYFDYFIGQTG